MNPLRNATWLKAGFLLLAIGFSRPAFAGPYTDALGKRLVESTTQADRVLLMRWMFAMVSLNPEFKDLTTVTPQQRSDLNRQVAKLFQDLLTVRCAKEAREAVRYEGAEAIQSSFKMFGEVAGREMFANPQVAAGADEMSKYLDKEKIKELFQEDGTSAK